jgi:hypothetical protein
MPEEISIYNLFLEYEEKVDNLIEQLVMEHERYRKQVKYIVDSKLKEMNQEADREE